MESSRGKRFLFSGILIFSFFASGQEPPNEQLERRLYEIYQKTQPVDDAAWSQLASRQSSNLYKIQSGDTLWDLSRTLFGDGFFWSKLWAENDSIYNPHRIEPGLQIQFVAGTESKEPSVSVVPPVQQPLASLEKKPAKALPAPVFKGDIAGGDGELDPDALFPKPEIPVGKKRTKALRNLPDSFVAIDFPKKGFEQHGVAVERPPPRNDDPITFLPTFIADQMPTGVGEVRDIEGSDLAAGQGQYVIVKTDRTMTLGEKLTAVFLRDDQEVSRGKVIDYGGLIEIFEVIDQQKQLYRGHVVLALNPIVKGARLTQDPLVRVEVGRLGARSTTQAKIIGGEFRTLRKAVGEHGVVFLDKGQDAGVREGDVMGVARGTDPAIVSKSFEGFAGRSIGLLKVVKVSDRVSTAVVLRALEEIGVGDVTGADAPKPKVELYQVQTSDYQGGGRSSSPDSTIDIPIEVPKEPEEQDLTL